MSYIYFMSQGLQISNDYYDYFVGLQMKQENNGTCFLDEVALLRHLGAAPNTCVYL